MKVLVVYHTVYGHVLQLAKAAEEGVKSVSGVEAVFRRAPEFPHTEKELEAGEGHAAKIWQAQKSPRHARWMTSAKRMAYCSARLLAMAT